MKYVPLSEAADVAMGTAPPGETYNSNGKGIPMIAGAGDYGLLYPEPKKWTTAPTRIAKVGDLIVCVRATIGDLNWADKEYCLGRGVAGVRPHVGKLDAGFVAHYITLKKADLRRLGTGSTFPAIRRGDLEGFPIPLPALAEQKRIAGILDAADALRAKRREALAQLDSLLQATFLDLFGDPVTNPKGWKTRTFSDLANDSFRNGLSPSTKGKVEGEVLTLSAITGGRFKFDERKEALFDKPPAASQMLSADTFLICRGNGNKRLVGAAAFPDRSSATVCFPDTIIGVTVHPEVLTAPYLQYVWASSHVRQQIESGARTTNGTFKVNQQTLGAVAFPVPSIVEQKRFARSASVIEKQRAACNAHLAELDALFASLQSRAFRGDL